MKFNTIDIVLLFLFLLAGCSSGVEHKGTENTPKLVFRLSNELKPDSRIWEVSNLFRNELEKASPDGSIKAGEIKVVFYDQGTVGSERQLLESCYFDVLEMVQVNSSILTMIDPAYSILDLPYLFVTEEQHAKVLNGGIGRKFLQRLEKFNLHGLGFYSTGFRNLFYKYPVDSIEVKSPQDFRGLKIRVMESPIMINSINAIGATATPIPFSELFQSMKTGVVDGAENSARIFMSYKYYEAGCNQFTITEHFANQHMLIANAKWFASLAPKYQRRITEAVAVSQKLFDEIWEYTTDESLEDMQKKGVMINEIKDKTPFILRANKVIEQFSNRYPVESEELLFDIMNMRNESFENQ